MIDRATIQRIMDAADIVDVVKEFVTLRKAGTNYKGLCPFHNEKTPSFVVSPSKQHCKCFSCGKGGNVVHFIMEHEQMTYPEALKWLAKKYGIEVHERELSDDEKKAATIRESMFVLNEWACKYFQDNLHNTVDGTAIGMAYFRKRGFRDDIIRKFGLGFALEERDAMAKAAVARGFSPEVIESTGLCYKTADGRLQDRYHGRVIFPVHTVSGMIVAFGGRILTSDKKVAKYVNSPESEIYSKSHELYGLYLAKHAIVKQGCCFLVEGYTDVISMHQSGIENVVASSGTSLTEGQIRLLHRFTNNITVLYDGDAAGIKASLRGIDMLLAEGLNIKVLLLPDGHDPDSFARAHRAAEFQDYIDRHQVDFIRFKTDLLLREASDDPIRRAELITDVVRSISVIPSDVVRQMYVRESASLLGVSEALIVGELGKIHHQAVLKADAATAQSDAASPTPPASDAATTQSSLPESLPEERLLIEAVMRYGELPMADPEAESSPDVKADVPTIPLALFVKRSLELDGLAFQTPLFNDILAQAVELSQTVPGWKAMRHFLASPEPEVGNLASDIATSDEELSTNQRLQYVPEEERLHDIVPRLIYDFKYGIVRRTIKQLLAELRNPATLADSERATHVMQEYSRMCAVERAFARELGDRVVLP